jgi:hypothetical protein
MPNWTKEQVLNHERKFNRVSPDAQSQRAVQHGSMGAQAGETGHPRRFHVRFISYRQRLLDPDNATPKYFLDCLRYAEIIPGDTDADLTFQIIQKQTHLKCNERTEIEVIDHETHQLSP